MQIAHCPVIARDNAFLSSRLIAIRDLQIKMKINDPPSPSSHCNSTRRETLDADIDSSMNERTRVNGSHTGSDATTFQLLESSIDQTSFLLSLSSPFANCIERILVKFPLPTLISIVRTLLPPKEGEEGRRKKGGRKGFEKRARQPLTRFIYLYVLHTIREVWLSHAFKFVCRNGARRLLMPSVTLLGGRI